MAVVDPGNVGRNNFLEHLQVHKLNDKEVREVLRQTNRSIAKEIRQIPGNTVSEQVRKAQYRQVQDSIIRQNNAGWREIGQVIDGNIGRVTAVAGEGSSSLIGVLGDNLPAELLRGMQAAADTSGERVAARIANRIDLSPRVYNNAALSGGKVDAIINDALGSNQSARELAARVAVYISPDTPGGMSYAAMRLGRTELNNAYHATNSALYNSQPWVEGSKWLLSGSHPKPDECNELAENDEFGMGGGVYRTSAIPGKPHPQCLCYTVPITPSRTDFIDKLLSGDYNNWMEENGLEPL